MFPQNYLCRNGTGMTYKNPKHDFYQEMINAECSNPKKRKAFNIYIEGRLYNDEGCGYLIYAVLIKVHCLVSDISFLVSFITIRNDGVIFSNRCDNRVGG